MSAGGGTETASTKDNADTAASDRKFSRKFMLEHDLLNR